MTALPQQSVIADRYELKDVIGQGGYGVVYRALDRQTGDTVAVKILLQGRTGDPRAMERMVREQQALVALAGKGAVSAIDLCLASGGALCLVMEWLDGMDLEQHFAVLEQAGRRLSIERLIRLLGPVVETLQRAHDIGIVHRDIKPANIFLIAPPREGVRLLDFGLARMKSSSALTAAGMVMGSPSYIAPEAWGGDSSVVDQRADLYSLGVIVFRALTGAIPFDTQSLGEKLALVTTAERPSIREFRPDLPPTIDDWAAQALAIDPALRFNTARAFYNALILSLDDSSVPAVNAPRHPPSVPPLGDIPSSPADRGTALARAWAAATLLLKRVAGPSSRPPPASSDPPADAPEVSTASPRSQKT